MIIELFNKNNGSCIHTYVRMYNYACTYWVHLQVYVLYRSQKKLMFCSYIYVLVIYSEIVNLAWLKKRYGL